MLRLKLGLCGLLHSTVPAGPLVVFCSELAAAALHAATLLLDAHAGLSSSPWPTKHAYESKPQQYMLLCFIL